MSKSLIPAQRYERIQEYLAIHKVARISDLSRLLDASEATVRRDLEWLESQGILERTHGGAILSQRLLTEPAYLLRAQKFPEEKRRIGALAASMIEDGDIVFINSGTTATQVIHHIRNNANVTVITNNLIATVESGEVGFEIFLLGGTYQPKSNSVAGRFAMDNLSQVYADKTFLGVDGISIKYGCTVPTNAEAEVVKLMIERTHGPLFVVADHSKWGVVSNFEIASVDQIDYLVTDEEFDEDACQELAEHSVEVLIAAADVIKP